MLLGLWVRGIVRIRLTPVKLLWAAVRRMGWSMVLSRETVVCAFAVRRG
jgi:hypothetical protein